MSDEQPIFENIDEPPERFSKSGPPLERLVLLQELMRLPSVPTNEVPKVETSLDAKIQVEENSFESGKQQAELARLNAELDGLKQDTDQRKAYAGRIFWLNVAWIAILAVIVLLSGFVWTHFTLPTSVLLALVGTTTLNILGTLYIVAQYLFPKKR